MKNDGGPAFPIPESNIVRDGYQSISTGARGMALRDWFAGQALIGIIFEFKRIARTDKEAEEFVEDAATMAYEYADTMLAERNKNSS